MKKNILGATMVVLAMFSGCETFEPQDDPAKDLQQESGNESSKEEFLITAKIGADTKTYLEWDETNQVYKTRWMKDDSFFLIDATQETLVYETCKIVEGEGTSTGSFAASLDADSYVALYAYGGSWSGYDKTLSVNLSSVQYHYTYSDQSDKKPFFQRAYPMVAKSDTKDFEFYNLCSVLKFTVTGDGQHLNNIRIRSNGGELLSGSGDVDIMSDVPSLTMTEGEDWVDYNVYEYLSSTPLECYVVLPAQTYSEGFTITFHTDKGWMDVTTGANITLGQSRLHEIKEPITYGSEGGHWILGANEALIMASEDDHYVMENVYLDGSVYFYNDYTEEYWCLSSQYEMSYYPLNTRINLESEYNHTSVPVSGYFDVYLYPEEMAVYIVEAGRPLSDLPTMEDVYRSDFSSLSDVEDGQCVMVSGIVVGTSERGFVLSMGYKNYNNVLVYNDQPETASPGIGKAVSLYTEKTTRNGLPGLIMNTDSWMQVYQRNMSFYLDAYMDLTNPEAFVVYDGSRYDYVKYSGILTENEGEYYVEVNGVEGRRGYIFCPKEDLSYLVGKTVEVDGYFIGFDENTGDLCTMMYRMSEVIESGGSTEDFILGDDIQM